MPADMSFHLNPVTPPGYIIAPRRPPECTLGGPLVLDLGAVTHAYTYTLLRVLEIGARLTGLRAYRKDLRVWSIGLGVWGRRLLRAQHSEKS